MAAIRSQITYWLKRKQLRTLIRFPPAIRSEKIYPSILVFVDAGRSCDHGQLSYLARLPVVHLAEVSFLDTLRWKSRKLRRPCRYE